MCGGLYTVHIPTQMVPFFTYPSSQAQWYDPTELKQVKVSGHGSPFSHSSMSTNEASEGDNSTKLEKNSFQYVFSVQYIFTPNGLL